ncbi:tetratricopeptide repeat protein [uncultured Methanobrevibacter sp.]|uniref:tetratricopeptide repeat protein n=1 Tax=uncultured Methanobrevibacter sp. TaxID=253161 RepID=UPI0025E73925|nr:hypothetical protein [uncultured Methanobrevibacter sp.]
MMTFSNIPNELNYILKDNMVKFEINNVLTNWIDVDDPFVQRILENNLNPLFLTEHLVKEIEIKNTLDEGVRLLNDEKYLKAIGKFDEVLYYDPDYSEALISKSYALRGQRHFVKALRYYRRAVKTDSSLKDIDYHKTLLGEANNERSNFPKLKLNIYAGDEHFAKGEFDNAVESYNRALANPSRFKDKILSKLLNKKATALIKLEKYGEAYDCFRKADGDYALFGQGYCEYKLGADVNDDFKKLLGVDKNHQLMQAMILNKLGFYREALDVCDYLADNHFKVDDYYRELLNSRIDALDGLGEDSGEAKKIADTFF